MLLKKHFYRINSLKNYISAIGLLNTINYILQRYLSKTDFLRIRIKKIKQPVYLRRGTADINVFQQIFVKQDLSFLKGSKGDVIIDAGANIGLATIYMKNLFPGSTIFAIEPELSNYNIFLKNIAGYSNVYSVNKALSENKEGLYMDMEGKGNDSFQTKPKAFKTEYMQKVESISIDNLIDEYNLVSLDIVKMDIEGAEEFCLDHSATNWLSITRTVAVEIHERIVPGVSKQIQGLMKGFSFSEHGEYSVFRNQQPV